MSGEKNYVETFGAVDADGYHNIYVDTTVLGREPWWADTVRRAGFDMDHLLTGPVPFETAEHVLGERVNAYAAAQLHPLGDLRPEYVNAFETVAIDGVVYHVVPASDYSAVGPAGRPAVFSMPSASYGTEAHQFKAILDFVERVTGGDLHINSVLKYRDGARCCVQLGTGELVKTDGGAFAPYIIAAGSWDMSTPSVLKEAVTCLECDNTADIAIFSDGGSSYRVKHTAHSSLSVIDAQVALGMVEHAGETFAAAIKSLCAEKVSEQQWGEILKALAPSPVLAPNADGTPAKSRSIAIAENKREQLDQLYRYDSRACPWMGSAWGAFQAASTWQQHYSTVRGDFRGARNFENLVNGKGAAKDGGFLKVIGQVIDRELVAV